MTSEQQTAAEQHSPVLQEATEWYLQLSSGEATDADLRAWQAWREADPAHEDAWKEIEEVTRPFKTFDAALGWAALENPYKRHSARKRVSQGRRKAMKQLAILFAVGTSGLVAYREKPWQEFLADYSTGLGESRELTLEDGTRLFLNTDSMVAVDFSSSHRVITLYKGEVLIETGHKPSHSGLPFRLQTSHGLITALGTRFSARQFDDSTSVNLFDGKLNIAPRFGALEPVVLYTGESLEFNQSSIIRKVALQPGADAWSRGFLIVDKMPLKDFLSELSRYRPGVMRCDPQIASLHISGAFPIQNTDAVLASIEDTLPIRIETFTRYWIVVKPT